MSEQVNLQEALVKKAAFGNDIDLEKFDDNNEQHVQSTAELSAAGKERLEHVGIDLERENRSASFIQVDNAPIEAEVKPQLPLELMNTGAAAKKYPELVKKYWWKHPCTHFCQPRVKGEHGRKQGFCENVCTTHP